MLAVSTLLAQGIPAKFKAYKGNVKLLNSKNDINGSIYLLEDSSITLINTLAKEDIQKYRFQPISIPISEIETIRVRRVGKTGKSMALGAATGMGIAVILGLSQGDDDCLTAYPCYSTGEYIKLYSFALIPPGAIIGAIVGAPSKKYHIDGSMHNYNQLRSALNDYAIVKGRE